MTAGTLTRWGGRLSALALLLATAVQAEVAVPPLTARVTDLTSTLTSAQVSSLEQKLAAFEARKGSQVAVLVVPTTQPEEIEQYSMRVVDAWKLGRRDLDDGALLLVAVNDRRLRIEVGRGLEGAVTDLAAGRIISETITPRFQLGDFHGGIDAGLTRLLALIDGEPLPEPDPAWSGEGRGVQELLPILLVVAVMAGAVLRRVLGRVPGAFATGCLVGGIAWLIARILFVGVFAGVLGFIVALMGAPGGRWASGRRGGWGGAGRGGFGGGGFRGGGGGFAGGGASGRW